jgi:hypothetical protein
VVQIPRGDEFGSQKSISCLTWRTG